MPDLAFRICQKKLSKPIQLEDGADADVDPAQFVGVQRKVTGRKVESNVELSTKWAVEVMGRDGKIDEL